MFANTQYPLVSAETIKIFCFRKLSELWNEVGCQYSISFRFGRNDQNFLFQKTVWNENPTKLLSKFQIVSAKILISSPFFLVIEKEILTLIQKEREEEEKEDKERQRPWLWFSCSEEIKKKKEGRMTGKST